MANSELTFDSIWGEPPGTMTAKTDLERVLVDGSRIPILHWRKNFFFKGALNESLKTLSKGEFPAKADLKGTHPVFALKPVLDKTGFVVWPCSSKSWRKDRWIEKGTQLLHTGYKMDKTSYLVSTTRIILTPLEAKKVRFKGEVDQDDIQYKAKGN